MKSFQEQFYRDPEQGKFAGVIAGVAKNWGLNSFWLRIVALVLLFSMPIVMIPAYLLAAVLMPIRSQGCR